MKRPLLFACAVVAAMGVVSPTAVLAKGKSGSNNRWGDAGKHRAKPKAQYEDITAVDEGAKTVSIGHKNGKDHSIKALKVNTFTEITLDGQKATLHDLKPGMKVDVTNDSDDVAAALTATA